MNKIIYLIIILLFFIIIKIYGSYKYKGGVFGFDPLKIFNDEKKRLEKEKKKQKEMKALGCVIKKNVSDENKTKKKKNKNEIKKQIKLLDKYIKEYIICIAEIDPKLDTIEFDIGNLQTDLKKKNITDTKKNKLNTKLINNKKEKKKLENDKKCKELQLEQLKKDKTTLEGLTLSYKQQVKNKQKALDAETAILKQKNLERKKLAEQRKSNYILLKQREKIAEAKRNQNKYDNMKTTTQANIDIVTEQANLDKSIQQNEEDINKNKQKQIAQENKELQEASKNYLSDPDLKPQIPYAGQVVTSKMSTKTIENKWGDLVGGKRDNSDRTKINNLEDQLEKQDIKIEKQKKEIVKYENIIKKNKELIEKIKLKYKEKKNNIKACKRENKILSSPLSIFTNIIS